MRINNPTDTNAAGISVTTTSAARAVDRSSGNSRTAGSGGDFDDQVQLSGLAGSLDSLRSDSPARLGLVDKLSKLVQGGEYKPDPTTIASSIVTEALGGVA